ncbi:unnamed protein product [Rotaria sp. Silwood1]|nr:unnamed protein product [Rotaria sp. Silwood1]CAF1633525.1 unnamed protein product [Rotaria sp. Silwood1]CAF3813391.1 unnamed protein product [Rotaria sp. Silwood1]CAF5024745.1 unnamed protein product [Rotaria sp. Silwood1]
MRSSISSRSCNNPGCNNSSRALCICCNQYLCIEHLKDHTDKQNDLQLNSLITKINVLSDRFHHISLVQPYFITNLDKWRADAYRTIDRFYETQRRHFEQFTQENQDKQRNELERLRLKINDLIREQNTTQEDIYLIKDTIKLIEKDLNELSNIQCNICPLVIDENIATLQSNQAKQDFLPLSRPYKTMNIIDNSYCWMATNEKYLLVHHKPDLYLLDRQLSLITKIPWTHGRIYIMCWSLTLNRFIVITNDTIFTIDENLTAIERCDLNYHNNIYRNWRSGTCSNTSLYLSTGELGTSIYEFTLIPSIQLIKEWSSPITCRKDECIDDLCYKNGKLAIIIFRQPTKEIRLDLRSSTTLDIIWSIEIGNIVPRRTTGCCWLNNDEWLITDEYDFRLFHISANGHLLKSDKYGPAPYNALLFGKDILAIRTIEGVNLHKL